MKTGIKVSDAMTEKPIYVTTHVTLSDVAKIMREKHVGGMIVKEGQELKGLVTEQDLVRKAVAEGVDPTTAKISEYMETEIISISPDDDIYEALVKMRDNNIRHLPVMLDTKLLGLLTIKDVLKIQPSLFDLIVEKFEIREHGRKIMLASDEQEDM